MYNINNFRIFSKKKDDKYMKVNENLKVNQDINNINKENLYQKFSSKDQNKNVEKPVNRIFFYIKSFTNFKLFFDYLFYICRRT